MTVPDVLAALGPVVAVLEGQGIEHYVCGSLASSTHGTPRSTLDVDIVADLRPEHVAAFVESLAGAYYLDEGRIRGAVAHRRSFNLIHLDSMFKVDIFVNKSRPFDRSALARAKYHHLGPDSLEQADGLGVRDFSTGPSKRRRRARTRRAADIRQPGMQVSDDSLAGNDPTVRRS